MSAEILHRTPTSGEYPEKHFGQTFNSQLWVRFMDNNYQEWVGCFPRPYQTFDKVLTDNANETAFIVTGGQGYLADITTRDLLHELDDIPALESILHTTNPEYFLIGACYCIYIFDNKKLIKRFDPDFTVDGIYFTEQKEQKAIGHLYSYQFQQDLNVGFAFDLITNEMTIDKNVKIRQLGPFEFVSVTEKGVKENENLFTRMLRRIKENMKSCPCGMLRFIYLPLRTIPCLKSSQPDLHSSSFVSVLLLAYKRRNRSSK